jgi:hypothetical protein
LRYKRWGNIHMFKVNVRGAIIIASTFCLTACNDPVHGYFAAIALPSPGPSDPSPSPSASPSPSSSGAVVCNPFGEGSGTSSAKLVASLNYFPFQRDPSTGFEINTIGNSINLNDFNASATFLTSNVFFSQVDVPSEHFTAGFPGADGQPLKDLNGNILDEYFSLDFKSQIVLGPNAPGNYQFLTLSDDGSILSLDTGSGMQAFISADGEHSSTVACSSSTVAMTANSKIPMDLDYFQGPQDTIALVVMWRLIPPGGSLSDPECNQDGGDNYYFNEDTLAPLGPYIDLLSRGWVVLTPDNYMLPAGTTNLCPGPTSNERPSPAPNS